MHAEGRISIVKLVGVLLLVFLFGIFFGFGIMSFTLVFASLQPFIASLPQVVLGIGGFVLVIAFHQIFSKIAGRCLSRAGDAINLKLRSTKRSDLPKNCLGMFILWILFAAGTLSGIFLWARYTKDILHI